MSISREKVVFIRVGWMDTYGHVRDGSRPLGGGSHNEEKEGGESSNFWFDEAGKGHGYVYINSTDAAFNLKRVVGSEAADREKAEGVLVVSVATDPEKGGQVIVGWHGNATCFGFLSNAPRAHVFTAERGDCVLIPREGRTFSVPRGKDGMGQFNVCYSRNGDGSLKTSEWIERALDFIEGYTGPNLLSASTGGGEDTPEEPTDQGQRLAASGFPMSMPSVPEGDQGEEGPVRDVPLWFPARSRFSLLSVREVAFAVNARPQRIRLPSFQRDAVWDWDDIELLWDSILRGYPMGSLLLARPHEELPDVRQLRKHREAAATATSPVEDDGCLVLLDGQQRASAIAIGLKPWASGDETRLWIDLAPPKKDRRYGFRLCSLTLPWGGEVTSPQKAKAIQALAGRVVPPGSAALEMTWPATAFLPVPFAELMVLVGQGRFADWPGLVPSALRTRADSMPAESEAIWRAVLTRALSYQIPAILMAALPSAEDLGETFKRLNTAGVNMTQEDLFFSGIKLKWPRAHDLVWDVYSDKETGRFLSSTKIVHLAARLASTRAPGSVDDVATLDLEAFRSHVEEGNGRDFLDGLAVYLEPRGGSRVGRLREVLRLAKDALSYSPESGEDDPGFPAPLLAGLRPHVWHVLAAWLDRHPDSSAQSRMEMLRFAALDHFFARPLSDSRIRRLFLRSRNTDGAFPGQALWQLLVEDEDRTLWLDLQTPARFETPLHDENGEAVVGVLGHEHDLVIWAQRRHVHRWYGDYDPTLYTGRRAEKPYDLDHIVPKSFFDQRRGHDVEQAPGFRSVRRGALHNAGNLRLWPKDENRRDQDASPAEKCLLGAAADETPAGSHIRRDPLALMTYGEVRRASFIPEEDWALWREASPEGVRDFDWSSARRLEAFAEAVQRRRFKMYRSMYEALGFDRWMEK